MRRHKLKLICLIAVSAVSWPFAILGKDVFPSKPVKIVVGFPGGSSADVAARVLAQRLGQSLGQQFIVDNRPGASSNIAARSVVTAPADGYVSSPKRCIS
jgi:tripartite-type tricarboxylate transporter receptor subunit TctC